MSASLADVNGNRLLVLQGADTCGATESPKLFFDRFSARVPSGFDTIIALIPDGPALRMRVLERDGSESAFCGNGSLAVGATLGHSCVIRTATEQASVHLVRGAVRGYIPRPRRLPISREREWSAYAACGEPHALYMAADIGYETPHELGTRHAPTRNCTIIHQVSDDAIRIRTFERGVNAETSSCGSGACASIAALEELGVRLARQVRVDMSGGTLLVTRHASCFALEAPVHLHHLT